MNIDGLLHKYFEGLTPTIEVFDDESIHRVDVEDEFHDTFLDTEDIDGLW